MLRQYCGSTALVVLWEYCGSSTDILRCTHIEVWDCGGLVHEERPDMVAKPFKLWMQGLGTYLEVGQDE